MNPITEYLEDEDRLIRIPTLIVGIVGIIGFFAGLDSFFEKLVTAKAGVRVAIYLAVLTGWIIFWLYKRYYLPQLPKDKIGIIIAVSTEQNEEKVRLRNNLLKRLNDLLEQNNLTDLVDITLLKNYQAVRLIPIFSGYRRKYIEIKKNPLPPGIEPKEAKALIKLANKIRAHFYIWGSIEQRNNIEKTYYIRTDALVMHPPVERSQQENLEQDFLRYWCGQLSFKEKFDFEGFNISADRLLVAAKYIIGAAAIMSGDPFTALRLHESLEHDLNIMNPLPAELIPMKNRLTQLLADEHFLAARICYLQNSDLPTTNLHLTKCLQLVPKSCGPYILQSTIEFLTYRDPKKALRSVEQAKAYSGTDGTWRYNKAFLLMYLEQFKEALAIYKSIIKNTYPFEEYTLNQIYDFNEKLLLSEPDKIQSHFILGYLKYKKEGNWPEALPHLEKFLAKTVGLKKYKLLIDETTQYLKEIEAKIKMPN